MLKSFLIGGIQRDFVHSTKPIVTRIFQQKMMSGEMRTGIALKTVMDKMVEFAPTKLAESWDNVGLLVEPVNEVPITHILLTNDLTEDVMDEALSINVNLIVSYHPPLFAALKKITSSTWKERIIAKCLANNIALFSPHTSWDVVAGGVTDWLASAFESREIKPLNFRKDGVPKTFIVNIETSFGLDFTHRLQSEFSEMDYKILCVTDQERFTIRCSENMIRKLSSEEFRKENCVKCFYATAEFSISKSVESVEGIGRICTLKNQITIRKAVEILKKHIGTSFVQLALARGRKLENWIETVVFVASSGGSLLKNVSCDLKVAGGASHREILDWIHNGSSVFLTNHSNSERGFLHQFKQILANKLADPSVRISISEEDSDPLKVL